MERVVPSEECADGLEREHGTMCTVLDCCTEVVEFSRWNVPHCDTAVVVRKEPTVEMVSIETAWIHLLEHRTKPIGIFIGIPCGDIHDLFEK